MILHTVIAVNKFIIYQNLTLGNGRLFNVRPISDCQKPCGRGRIGFYWFALMARRLRAVGQCGNAKVHGQLLAIKGKFAGG